MTQTTYEPRLKDDSWWIHATGSEYPAHSYVFRTREEAEIRIGFMVQYDDLTARVEEAIGQNWPYGIRVWSEPREGATPRWYVTDAHTGQDRSEFGWYSDTPPPVWAYTRELYERACAAVGIEPAADGDLNNYADKYGDFRVGEYPPIHVIMFDLRRRRIAGIVREQPPAPPVQAEPEKIQDEPCDECGMGIVEGSGMRASFGLACDVDCYDILEDRRGRFATKSV